jgi:hypothetical protein
VDARNQVRFDKLEKQNNLIIQMLEKGGAKWQTKI